MQFPKSKNFRIRNQKEKDHKKPKKKKITRNQKEKDQQSAGRVFKKSSKQKKDYSTQDSQVVPNLTTN